MKPWKESPRRAAVFAGYTVDAVHVGVTADGTPYVRVRPENYRASAERLWREGFKLLYLGVIEWSSFFEVAVSVYSQELRLNGIFSTLIGKEKPRLPSLSDIFPSAVFYEDEAYEMYGIVFEGHPGLRRLFTEETLGHPFRKESRLQETPVGGWRPVGE